MSDLQISLAVIGALVVVGVYVFNGLQERRLRRRLEQAFGAQRADVLLDDGAVPARGRVEPSIPPWNDAPEARIPEPDDEPQTQAESQPDRHEPAAADHDPALPPVPGFDESIDYVAEVQAADPVPQAALAELLSRMSACGKPWRVAGLAAGNAGWDDVTQAGQARYSTLRVALQLANRQGPLSAAQLAAFREAVQVCASKAGGEASGADPQVALDAARELDGFCADHDVAIGVNIIARPGSAFSGTKIRGLAEAAGFKLEPDGLFHFRNDERQTLFTLDNHEPAPFLPEQIKSLSTGGITLLLDVPRVAHGQQALERMIEIGKAFAQSLDGTLVDDNRVALNAAGIAAIRQQLQGLQEKMDAQGISAGSERAIRLFS
jgi:FtsZ-interacting cell division protein ZipA